MYLVRWSSSLLLDTETFCQTVFHLFEIPLYRIHDCRLTSLVFINMLELVTESKSLAE